MQITLEVNGSQLDNEVKDLLSKLTDEQKSQMGMEMLQKTLNNAESRMSIDTARSAAVVILNAGINAYDKVRWDVDRQMLVSVSRGDQADYSTRERFIAIVKEKSDVATYFKDKVLPAMVTAAEKEIVSSVKNSPEIAAAIDQAKKIIQEQLPKMVNDAMILYFASQMENMMRGVAQSMFQSGNAAQITQQLQQALANKGVY